MVGDGCSGGDGDDDDDGLVVCTKFGNGRTRVRATGVLDRMCENIDGKSLDSSVPALETVARLQQPTAGTGRQTHG